MAFHAKYIKIWPQNISKLKNLKIHKSKQRHTGQQAPPKGPGLPILPLEPMRGSKCSLPEYIICKDIFFKWLCKGSAGSLRCLNIFPSQLLLNATATAQLSFFGLKMPSTHHNKLYTKQCISLCVSCQSYSLQLKACATSLPIDFVKQELNPSAFTRAATLTSNHAQPLRSGGCGPYDIQHVQSAAWHTTSHMCTLIANRQFPSISPPSSNLAKQNNFDNMMKKGTLWKYRYVLLANSS